MCSGHAQHASHAREGQQNSPQNIQSKPLPEESREQQTVWLAFSADLSSTCRLRRASAPRAGAAGFRRHRDVAEPGVWLIAWSPAVPAGTMRPPPAQNSPRLWCALHHHPTLWSGVVTRRLQALEPGPAPAAAPRDRPPAANCPWSQVKRSTTSAQRRRRSCIGQIAEPRLHSVCHETTRRHRAVAGSF